MVNKDVFKNSLDVLKNKKLFLFDMDGTIYNDDILFEGTIDLFNQIKKQGGNYIFITNNSSKSVKEYIEKLSKMGIEVNYDNFFTSTQASIYYLNKKYPNEKIYCMGTKSFIKELCDSNINVTEEITDGAKVVLIGYDTELNYNKLIDLCKMLCLNVDYIATNPDLVCPTKFGFVPDCGSIAQIIYNATKRNPIFIGKPESTMIDLVMQKFNATKEETVVIGDRLYTDILSGLNAGVLSICVLTGEATKEDIINGKIKPDLTINSINDIYLYLNVKENINS